MSGSPAGPTAPSVSRTTLVVVAVIAALVGALSGSWFMHTRNSPPSDFGADAGFSRDMQAHHAQAVEMALLVRERSDDEIPTQTPPF